jgi:hypothetical protein
VLILKRALLGDEAASVVLVLLLSTAWSRGADILDTHRSRWCDEYAGGRGERIVCDKYL